MASVTSLLKDTKSYASRTTRDGRQLEYRMEVVQQPERARACGAGAKSSADRRPVDPPPIVALRILERTAGGCKDITFSYNALFFLYTTLEHAEAASAGRIPISTNVLPVLTGTPVAGMAYLERPTPAGYFIFPDLAIRHEGSYRLSFNLYEELKEPEKDADVGAPEGSPRSRECHLANDPHGPHNFVYFRCEVKSSIFPVYSAKRFPGLSESTTMSRTVNEQGCRVRIRRDIRMRHRKEKEEESYADMDDDTTPLRTEDSTSSQNRPERLHSHSPSGRDMDRAYNVERRSSVNDTSDFSHSSFPQNHSSVLLQQNAYGASQINLANPADSHYTVPVMSSSSTSALSQFSNPQSSFPYGSVSHLQEMNVASAMYPYAPQQLLRASYPQSNYTEEEPHHTSRQPSSALPLNHTGHLNDVYLQMPPNSTVDQDSRSSYSASLGAGPHTQGPQPLPPIRNLVGQPPLEPRISASIDSKTNPSMSCSGPQNPFSISTYASSGYQNSVNMPVNGKSWPMGTDRRFQSATFDFGHVDHTLYGNLRSEPPRHAEEYSHILSDDGASTDINTESEALNTPLVYKRADGSSSTKRCPSPRDRSFRPY